MTEKQKITLQLPFDYEDNDFETIQLGGKNCNSQDQSKECYFKLPTNEKRIIEIVSTASFTKQNLKIGYLGRTFSNIPVNQTNEQYAFSSFQIHPFTNDHSDYQNLWRDASDGKKDDHVIKSLDNILFDSININNGVDEIETRVRKQYRAMFLTRKSSKNPDFQLAMNLGSKNVKIGGKYTKELGGELNYFKLNQFEMSKLKSITVGKHTCVKVDNENIEINLNQTSCFFVEKNDDPYLFINAKLSKQVECGKNGFHTQYEKIIIQEEKRYSFEPSTEGNGTIFKEEKNVHVAKPLEKLTQKSTPQNIGCIVLAVLVFIAIIYVIYLQLTKFFISEPDANCEDECEQEVNV